MTDDPRPRIYVASLNDYSAGRLHGIWINAAQEPGGIWASVAGMLAASPEPGAEEWAIHDHDGFGPVTLGEYEDLTLVAALGIGIVRHGTAFAVWAQYLGRDQWRADLDKFEDAYQGCWSSETEYAEDVLDGLSFDPDKPAGGPLGEYLHFDLAAFARDLAADYAVIAHDGQIYVFEP
jgi:antirestriction protein